jgi:hypothetical protein
MEGTLRESDLLGALFEPRTRKKGALAFVCKGINTEGNLGVRTPVADLARIRKN